MYVPRKVFFTKGVGRHKEKLTSFEMALRDAGIASFNLVRVSSIFPPGCKIITPKTGLNELKAGQILHVVISENATNEPNRLIAASVGVAIPADKKQHGYLSEHHSFGENEKKAGDYAEELAVTMLSTIMGIEQESGKSSREFTKDLKIGGKIVRTQNITQTAVGDKDGIWTTVVAAAVLLP
ncbi:MAG: arginine decarboxylase, pyruvoyl-dependent [Calditrichia bacterium]